MKIYSFAAESSFQELYHISSTSHIVVLYTTKSNLFTNELIIADFFSRQIIIQKD
ncbi:hypothetical protein IC221_06695 [Flammeovirga sp. EKP202]|nr:hypothetical protein [Flammeovirga sp. EKP202]